MCTVWLSAVGNCNLHYIHENIFGLLMEAAKCHDYHIIQFVFKILIQTQCLPDSFVNRYTVGLRNFIVKSYYRLLH